MSVHATLRLSTPLVHLQLRVATLDPIVEVDCVADVRANTLPASGRKESHFLHFIFHVFISSAFCVVQDQQDLNIKILALQPASMSVRKPHMLVQVSASRLRHRFKHP